ncbi:MAG: rRNA maturation RNase YbeY [Methyloceanibacter sp.]|nr:rRNA maturation RNase YbeY [Methyloceanibacter sp.]
MSEDGPRPGGPQTVAVSALDVEVMRHDDAWTERGVSDASIELAAQAAFTVSPPAKQAFYELTIVLTDDAESRDLNRTWRNKDQPTNVLSFPAGDMPDTKLLGDIVIAFETTAAEAADKTIPLADHVSHLVVHGTLHLLGHDHLDDAEAERMEELERRALASLGITDPYADDMPARDGNAGLAEIA